MMDLFNEIASPAFNEILNFIRTKPKIRPEAVRFHINFLGEALRWIDCLTLT